MKKRVLSLFLAFVLCLTLLPTSVFAEGADGSAAAGAQTEGNGQLTNTGEGEQPNSETDTRTEIWCVSKPDSIGRGYDGTTDGSTIPIDLTFTDGTKTFELEERTGFTAKKTFDSADAGWHTVTVEIELIGEVAAKYKLRAGEESFTIGGNINKAHPDLNVSLSKTACTVGENLLPLLSVEGAPEGAAVTYYYTKNKILAGQSRYEGNEAMPEIDENTAISEPGTYYVYAKTGETKNYEEERSTTAELTVSKAVVEAASITKADGTDGGTYESLPAALNAARDGDTVNLLENHTTHWGNVEAGEEQMAVVKTRITLDLNGNTVDYLVVGEVISNEEGVDSYDGNLTVKSSRSGGTAMDGQITTLRFVQGTLSVQDGVIIGSSSSSTGLICGADSGAVAISGGTVTISGGTVYNATVGKGAAVTVSGGSEHAGNWHNDGTLNITGGTFGSVKFYNNSGTIAISGGTFNTLRNFGNESEWPIAPMSLLAPGHAFYDTNENTVKDGSSKDFLQNVTVKEHTHTMVNNKCACGLSCTHTNAEGASTIGKDGKCTACGTQFTAVIGETYYADVPSALNAAADGQTVKLLANEMLSDGIYVSKTLTLDLNGHSLDGYSLNVGGLTATSQVRTGNLTVIDSSGGNGAVGVTVRNGGTLVFNPENDNTTLLQLEVWGGTVELYGGKISRNGLRLNNNITLGNLLPGGAGLAYYCGDTQLTLAEAASQTCDHLVVKSCSHGGKNGFDNNSATCPYCNAPAVAETALYNGEGNCQKRRFADLQTAIDADRAGGSEFTLLTDVTGDYTIDGTQNTGLNLNGHSITGTVTVKGIKGDYITTTLSNTQNTTTASIDKVVAYDGAELAGSGHPAVIGTLTLAEGATWKTILNDTALGYKVLNTDGTHKWYAQDDVNGSQLNNVIINRLPITRKNLAFKVNGTNVKGNKAERGTTVQLCADCNANDVTVTFSILKTGETTPITLSGNDVQYTTVGTGTTKFYVAAYDFNDVGSYTISFTATKDGYTVTSTPKKLTVTKLNLSNAEITFPDGNEAAFNYATMTGVPTFVVTYKGQTLKKDVDYTIAGGSWFSGVGSQTLTIKAKDNGNYTGSKSAEWSVRPLKVAVSVGDIVKTYDGTTNLPANAKITLKSADSYYTGATGVTLPLAKGTDYEVLNARYDFADASQEEKTISFTVKLKNAGYVFEDGTTQKDFTLNGVELEDKSFKINKAAAPTNIPTGTLNVINGTQQTYTYDFSKLLPELSEGQYGTISYGNQPAISLVSQSGYYYDETIVEFHNGVLILAQFYAKDGIMTGQIGTVKVKVTTTNYEDFELTLVLNAINKIKPTPDGKITASEITYGDTLSKSEISGTMKDPNTGDEVKGTFTWTDGTIKPDANDRYEAEWTFTPDSEEYATVTGTATVEVDKARQYGEISMAGYSYGGTPSTPTLTDRTGDPNAQVLYTYCTADSGHVQTWDIQNPPALNAGTYHMFAQIGETNNYYEYNAKYCEFVVAKATPPYTKPTGLTAKYGQTLADVTLPDDWSWMESSESVGSASTAAKKFKAKFTPTDTDNYNVAENIELEVTVNKADQAALTIQGADSVLYGQTLTLTASGGSGTGAVTYRVDTVNSTGEATIDPNTGVLTPVKVGSVSVIATKAGGNDYNDVTSALFVLMVKPAAPTGAPKYTKITTSGKTLKDAALTTEGSTLKPTDGKLEWVDDKGNVLPDSTGVKANTTYKWRFTPTNTNYTTLTGEIELYHKSGSSGGSSGGGSSYNYYAIKAAAGAGGTISPSGNVSIREGRDQTFTITPDKGYAVSDVKIDGKSIGAVKSYTFENVSRTHTIEAIFMKASSTPQTGGFVDVVTGSYYEEAVAWAVENAITQGIDSTHFFPNDICTRAQAVTFLWRAAGSPAPKTRTMPFTDVPVGSY